MVDHDRRGLPLRARGPQQRREVCEASSAEVRLAKQDGHLTFEVRNDGAGFDVDGRGHGTGLQGMADRLEAIGGTLEVQSSPGTGTRVMGRVPVSAEATT